MNHSENINNKIKDNNTKDKNITRHVKAAIIGAGTAGHNAYRQISKVTDDLVIINEGIWSTTCTTMGCMPSKLLIAAGERAHHADHSDDFGIEGKAVINGKQVMRRVQRERDHFASYPLKNAEQWGDHKIYGRAVFNEAGLIEVQTATGETEIIKADHIVIATGSKPFVPDGWKEKLGDLLITSDTIFEMPDLPKSLAVVGTGAIGLELAQAMSRLGVEVTLFNRARRVGGIKDDQVNDKAIDCLSKSLDLRLDITINDVATSNVEMAKSDSDNADSNSNKKDKLAVIRYTDAGSTDAEKNEHTWQGEMVLVATGRRNTIHMLGLEHLGVHLDDKNRPQDMNYVTGHINNTKTDKNVYIVGDANGYRPLLHVTSNEGYLAGKEIGLAISNSDQSLDDAINSDEDTLSSSESPIINDITVDKVDEPEPLMSVIFSDPQIMAVGHTIKSIEDRGLPYVIGEVSFDNQGRSRIMGVNCGLLRIYVNPENKLILGASMVGPAGEYIAHILTTAMTNQITVDGLLDNPFYHPTILEGLRTALRDAKKKFTAWRKENISS